MYKSSNNKQVTLDNVNLKEEIKNMKGIAIMLEQDDGTYVESNTNTFPTDMKFNSELSGCIDNLGNRIEDSLTYENGIANVETSNTSYCYLYFDKKTISLGEKVIQLDLELDTGLQQEIIPGDNLYRFAGTEGNTGINNYICLGTNSCTSGDDNMYRIIGVNPDNGEVKVIKETPWNNGATYVWHSSNADVTWLTSSLYTGRVAGIYDELDFKDMIVTKHTWNVGNAKSTSVSSRKSAISFENNTTGTATIGIMSLSDYYLAYNGDRNWRSNYDINVNWINLHQNSSISAAEHTMTYYGVNGSDYDNWTIAKNYGQSTESTITLGKVIRPTFYLKPEVVYISGDGTFEFPYIVELETDSIDESYLIEGSLSKSIIDNETLGLQKEIIDGDNLYRFAGTEGNTGINNYICLGTNSCTSGDDNMYRIIGVNPKNGEIKVIKETPWNNGEKYSGNDGVWVESDVYINTVSLIYDTLSFKNIIVTNHIWYVGGTTGSTTAVPGTSATTSLDTLIKKEKSTFGIATIGILSLSDYYLAYNGEKSWGTDYDNTSNWIGGYLNGNTNAREWTMTYWGYCTTNLSSYSWSVASTGQINAKEYSSTYVLRPTFYLKPEVMYVTGKGTSANPFIINYE